MRLVRRARPVSPYPDGRGPASRRGFVSTISAVGRTLDRAIEIAIRIEFPSHSRPPCRNTRPMAEHTERLFTLLADRYRIERRLGEGGMATVYLAEDLRHDRKVALKVLRPELAAMLGADRFMQEIKTTAQLQHAHILPLYDSGSTATTQGGGTGFLYYVMPYIAGETLREKLDREVQLGVDEAVKITSEVAGALQYAHEQGVIHRDIKPENILLHNGRALVADFGIAFAVSAAAGARMTETGLSLGTPHYMSPEQATADKHITHRSDIYSLGSLLYEMLAGEPPHTASSAQAVIMKILTDEVRPVRELRRTVPPHVAAAVAKAVEKLPADRFDSAKAFAEALHNPAFAPPVAAAGPPSRRFVVPALSALIILTAVLAAWGWLTPGRARSVARYPTTLGAAGALDGIALRVETALSPDGASLVFRHPLTGPGQLYLKRRDEVTARPLAGTEGGSGPFFSPDGAWIGFVAQGQLRRVPSTGGASLKLADSVHPIYNQGAWLTDGSIFYYDAPTRTLRRLRSGETTPQVIASPATLDGHYPWLPAPLPDARGILFTAHLTNCVGPVSCRPSRVYAYDARSDSVRMLFDDAVGAWHVSTGHVLYLTSSGTLMAVPWNNSALAATGRPVPLLDGIQAPGFVVSGEGTAVYLLGPPEFAPGPTPNASLVWVDRSGRVEPVDSSWQVNTGGTYTTADLSHGWGLALSPDGRRVALTLLTDLGTDVWIKQLPAGPVSRLTLYPGEDRAPAWTPDGRAITFLSDRPIPPDTTRRPDRFGLWEQSADGTGEARLLREHDSPTDGFLSPDGRWIVLGSTGSAGASAGGDILAAQSGVDSEARRILATGYDEVASALSPDSRWLAYVSNEQGEREVFVRPFPDVNGGKWQVSSGGGSAPLWAHNGRELFYVGGNNMYAVRIHPGPPFSAEPPRVLFTIPDRVRAGALTRGTFAIAPDDQRFLMVRDNSWEEMAGTRTLVVVENFFQELRTKLKK
jgi:Tol biopolymer transport system component